MKAPAALIFQILLLLFASQSFCLGASLNLAVSATILSNNQCKFKNPSSRTLAFGALDPLNPVDIERQTTLSFTCNGSSPQVTYLVDDNDGSYESGPNANRMLHQTLPGVYLPYEFAIVVPFPNITNKGVTVTLDITGKILGADYQYALAGSYSDTIVVTVQP